MPAVLFVTAPGSDAAPPAELGLLPHRVNALSGVDGALTGSADADLVVVDARADLAWAKSVCSTFEATHITTPLLLLVNPSGLGVISPTWGFTDFVLADAEPAEWDARIKLALRAETNDLISAGPIVIDEAGYSATVAGEQLDLTYTEFELLKFLVLHPGRVLTREHLLSQVWGYDYYGGTRTVDVHIRRLRAKLGQYDSHIGTVRNVGYRFSR